MKKKKQVRKKLLKMEVKEKMVLVKVILITQLKTLLYHQNLTHLGYLMKLLVSGKHQVQSLLQLKQQVIFGMKKQLVGMKKTNG